MPTFGEVKTIAREFPNYTLTFSTRIDETERGLIIQYTISKDDDTKYILFINNASGIGVKLEGDIGDKDTRHIHSILSCRKSRCSGCHQTNSPDLIFKKCGICPFIFCSHCWNFKNNMCTYCFISGKLSRKVKRLSGQDKFRIATAKMPNYSINQYREMEKYAGFDPLNDKELRNQLAVLRFQNPLCNNPKCTIPKGSVPLKRCSCCYLVTYCTPQCQSADWNQHRFWASQLPHVDAEYVLKNDPYNIIFCHSDMKKDDRCHGVDELIHMDRNGEIKRESVNSTT